MTKNTCLETLVGTYTLTECPLIVDTPGVASSAVYASEGTFDVDAGGDVRPDASEAVALVAGIVALGKVR